MAADFVLVIDYFLFLFVFKHRCFICWNWSFLHALCTLTLILWRIELYVAISRIYLLQHRRMRHIAASVSKLPVKANCSLRFRNCFCSVSRRKLWRQGAASVMTWTPLHLPKPLLAGSAWASVSCYDEYVLFIALNSPCDVGETWLNYRARVRCRKKPYCLTRTALFVTIAMVRPKAGSSIAWWPAHLRMAQQRKCCDGD